jgi:TRAP-type C4-dicarboxylate transport system permease small subunit
MMVRKLLTITYQVSGGIAGAFLVGICAIVTAQVLGNIIDRVLILTVGNPIGIVIPAYSDFAGFFLASSTFFALAYTLMSGEHIRVHLLLNRLSPRTRRLAELWSSAFSAVVAGVATYFATLLALESRQFGDVIPGMVPLPLWIPQLAMVLGLAVLTLALVDTCLTIMKGGRPLFDRSDPSALSS